MQQYMKIRSAFKFLLVFSKCQECLYYLIETHIKNFLWVMGIAYTNAILSSSWDECLPFIYMFIFYFHPTISAAKEFISVCKHFSENNDGVTFNVHCKSMSKMGTR